MKYHSQNNEAKIVLDYFGKKTGTVLDIGANDGFMFSNSYDLIEAGWYGVLFEPGHVYDDLHRLYKGNSRVHTHRMGVGERDEVVKFYQSGAHVPGGKDKGLVSSLDEKEIVRWQRCGVDFREIQVQLIPFSWIQAKYPVFDFITIDCEGHDWKVLRQIDLNQVSCRCLCVEWNGDAVLRRLYANYVMQFGFREMHKNAENVIFAV